MKVSIITLRICVAVIALIGVLPMRGQKVVATVPVGSSPAAIDINTLTNKIYVANSADGTVTQIDAATNATSTFQVGANPVALAVNAVTNKVYVSNSASNNVTVIDPVANVTTNVAVPYPDAIAVNPVTNKIYVGSANGITVIDGATNSTVVVLAGTTAIAVNPVTNKVYTSTDDFGCNSCGFLNVLDGATNLVTTLLVDGATGAVAVNTVTNQVYVTSIGDPDGGFPGIVTSFDGATNQGSGGVVGYYSPSAIAVNPFTNKIYVADLLLTESDVNENPDTVAVIDGATDNAVAVAVGSNPVALAINTLTDKIYVANSGDNTVTVIDGVTNSTTTLPVGTNPVALAVNTGNARTYVVNQASNNVTVIDGSVPLQLIPVTPCRVADTRSSAGPFGGPKLTAGETRDFQIPNSACGIPANASAYSLNVTVVPDGELGFLAAWPSGQPQPNSSTLNSDGRVKANAAIISAGASGGVSVYASDATHVILDVDGYFVAGDTGGLDFYPLAPCRIADTRSSNAPLGGPFLAGGAARSFPVLSSACGIPTTAQAYSLNFTVVPHAPLGFLAAWPAGQPQPLASILNSSSGVVTANAAIVPAGNSGAVEVYASNDSDIVIDVNGYFASPTPGGLSLYTAIPCRALDTRANSGVPFQGVLTLNVSATACAVPVTAEALIFNATVVPSGIDQYGLSYLSLWPTATAQPLVSTLNASDGAVTSNMAIVPANAGSIDAFATDLTHLILDVSGYFAP